MAEVDRREVGTIYVEPEDRWVVSLIVSYPEEYVHNPRQAAKAALELTRDAGRGGTQWFVYDRETGRGEFFEQDEIEEEEIV